MALEQQPKPIPLDRTFPAVAEVLQELTNRGIHVEEPLTHLLFLTQDNHSFPIDVLTHGSGFGRLVYQCHEQGMAIQLKDAEGNPLVIAMYDLATRKMKTVAAKPNGFFAQAVPNDGIWDIDWRNSLFPSEERVFLFSDPPKLPLDGEPLFLGMRIHTDLMDPWGLMRRSAVWVAIPGDGTRHFLPPHD